MERLTERSEVARAIFAGDDTPIGNALRLGDILERLASYEDTGLTPEICAEYKKFEDEAVSKGVPFPRIVELMEAEKDGRLYVPPVKVGDKVYSVTYDEVPGEYIVGEPEEIVEVGTRGFFLAWDSDPSYPVEFHSYEEIGKEFFLNIEDALHEKEKLEGRE